LRATDSRPQSGPEDRCPHGSLKASASGAVVATLVPGLHQT
ncbi:hypothetical protein T01_15111, partial [Trichinella spiralis]